MNLVLCALRSYSYGGAQKICGEILKRSRTISFMGEAAGLRLPPAREGSKPQSRSAMLIATAACAS